ncbi:flavodoxin family protein [Chloroflexota bacterium]
MKTLVVYDSMYGNTEKIAKAIGHALVGDFKVRAASEVDAAELEFSNLLIVGSPTQGFQPTKPIQAFIASIPPEAINGKFVAAFDTRISADKAGKGLRFIMKIGGYAAPRIAKSLVKRGGNLVVPAEGFFVKDKEGPLVDGEIERAARWARSMAH